jgi:hypothetical protein
MKSENLKPSTLLHSLLFAFKALIKFNPRRDQMRASPQASDTKRLSMKIDFSSLMALPGYIACCLVDIETGMLLASDGGNRFRLDMAAAGNTEVVRAKQRTLASLDLDDQIEDILITLGKHFHLIRLLESNNNVFLYLAVDRNIANLAFCRMALKKVEQSLSF